MCTSYLSSCIVDYIIFLSYMERMLFILHDRETFSYFDVQYTVLKVHNNCSNQFDQNFNRKCYSY